jgi:hypothetical protein
MFWYTTILILTGFIFSGCNQKGKYYPPVYKDSPRKTEYKTDSIGQQEDMKQRMLKENDLQLFCNNEIVSYCALLPLNEFKEVYTDQSLVKAQHKFVLKNDTANFTSIELQAFTIDKRNYYNTQLFYKRDKRDVEEGGLGIDTAYIDEANHYYLIKGYLPNYMNMKFVQLNWILEDRIAFYFNYDEKDELIWKKRIATIIKRGVIFSDK